MVRFDVSDRGRFSQAVSFDGWVFYTQASCLEHLRRVFPSHINLLAKHSVGEDAELCVWTSQGVCLGTLHTV